jgi:cholesterol transport system auxiliary component
MTALAALLVSSMLACCALTSKGDALSIRYFDPETARPRITSASSAAGSATATATTTAGESSATGPSAARTRRGQGVAVELGRVSSGINLREKIAYRDAAFEVGFYDDKRWTERPEVYVRRELARTLFEERGMRRALAGQAPVLEVEVVAFEELRGSPASARIQLRILVHDDRDVFLEKTISVDRPVPATAKGFDGLVQAMAQALDVVADQVANEVASVLAARPEVSPP